MEVERGSCNSGHAPLCSPDSEQDPWPPESGGLGLVIRG